MSVVVDHKPPNDDHMSSALESHSSIELPTLHAHPTNAHPDHLSAVPSHLFTDRVRRRPEVATVHVSLEHPVHHASVSAGVDVDVPPVSHESTHAPSVLRPREALEVNDQASVMSPTELARQRRRGIAQFIAVCFSMFLVGWSDGTTGPLLPVMQAYYHVNFTVVSLIFIMNTIGCIVGALTNVYLNQRIGFGKTIVLGSITQTIAYALQAPAGPFPLMLCAYLLGGLGLALQSAQGNGFVGSLRDSHKMGVIQASYGIGAFVAPLLSTFFATQAHWSFHYLVSMGLSLLNLTSLVLVFRLRRQEEIMADAGIPPAELEPGSGSGNHYYAMARSRALHFLALFGLIYVGTEVTLGGWIVTYIIVERKGGPSAGYISSGFFGGLALGRVALMWLNKLIGENRVMYIYAPAAIGLEVTVWFVPSLVGNAVAISFIGFLLGPMYPILMNHSARILPRWLLTSSIGMIEGIGAAGSALLPFITGAIASRAGIGALQPLLISMMGSLVLLWFFIPKGHARAG